VAGGSPRHGSLPPSADIGIDGESSDDERGGRDGDEVLVASPPPRDRLNPLGGFGLAAPSAVFGHGGEPVNGPATAARQPRSSWRCSEALGIDDATVGSPVGGFRHTPRGTRHRRRARGQEAFSPAPFVTAFATTEEEEGEIVFTADFETGNGPAPDDGALLLRYFKGSTEPHRVASIGPSSTHSNDAALTALAEPQAVSRYSSVSVSSCGEASLQSDRPSVGTSNPAADVVAGRWVTEPSSPLFLADNRSTTTRTSTLWDAAQYDSAQVPDRLPRHALPPRQLTNPSSLATDKKSRVLRLLSSLNSSRSSTPSHPACTTTKTNTTGPTTATLCALAAIRSRRTPARILRSDIAGHGMPHRTNGASSPPRARVAPPRKDDATPPRFRSVSPKSTRHQVDPPSRAPMPDVLGSDALTDDFLQRCRRADHAGGGRLQRWAVVDAYMHTAAAELERCDHSADSISVGNRSPPRTPRGASQPKLSPGTRIALLKMIQPRLAPFVDSRGLVAYLAFAKTARDERPKTTAFVTPGSRTPHQAATVSLPPEDLKPYSISFAADGTPKRTGLSPRCANATNRATPTCATARTKTLLRDTAAGVDAPPSDVRPRTAAAAAVERAGRSLARLFLRTPGKPYHAEVVGETTDDAYI
jgi:hypothetical protein